MEAISVLDEHAEDIAVLLTDVRMPGTIDGITLAENCKKKLGRGYAQLSLKAVWYRLISPYRKPPSSSMVTMWADALLALFEIRNGGSSRFWLCRLRRALDGPFGLAASVTESSW